MVASDQQEFNERRYTMAYKLVVESSNVTYVRKRGKDKKALEDLALKLSMKKPHDKFYVVKDTVKI
jgi:hypothetical protein